MNGSKRTVFIMATRKNVTNLPKLHGAEAFINWRRSVKAYIQQSDASFIGIREAFEEGPATQKEKWFETSVKAKSTITPTFAVGPLVQVSLIVDDDEKSAKELWVQLDSIYRMASTRMVINTERDLASLTFDKDEERESHLERFSSWISTWY